MLKNEYVYGIFWLAIILLIAFAPTLVGRQMLFEYASTVFSSSSGRFYQLPGIKTGWVWGGTNLTIVEAPKTISGLRMLKEDGWPLWSPYAAGGYPLGADLIGGFYFWPKLILFYLFSFLETFNYWLVLRLLIAGFGTFLFIKRLALSRQAALIGAIAYMLSGHMIVNIDSWWQNVVIILPYVLWSFESYFQTFQKKYIGLPAIFLSLLILGGQPQTTMIDGLLLSAYTLYRLFIMEDWRRLWRKYIGFLALSSFWALAMALPMVIDFSTSFFNGISIHHNDPQVFKYFSLAQILYFFVSPTMFLELALFGRILTASNPIVFQYYSITVWLLALAGLFARTKNKLHPATPEEGHLKNADAQQLLRSRQVQYFFAGYLVFDFLKLMGVPPIHWISYVPPFNVVFWLEHDNTFVFSLAILAALGYEKIKTSAINWKKFLGVAAIVPIIFTASFLFFRGSFNKLYLPNFDLNIRRADPMAAFNHLLEKSPIFLAVAIKYFFANEQIFIYLLFLTVIVFGASFLLAAWRAQKTGSKAALRVIIILLATELFVYMPKIRDGFFKPFNPYPKHPAIEFLQKQDRQEPWRFIATKDIIAPQTSAIFGLEDFRTNEAVLTEKYIQYASQFMPLTNLKHLMKEGQKYQISNSFSFDEGAYLAEKHHHFLDLANIKYVVSDVGLRDKDLMPVFNNEGLIVYENKTVLPRAYAIVNGKIFRDKNFINIIKYQANKVFIKTNLPANGQLILSDAYYPGWRAYVDGQEIKIYPINIMFRAILAPAGEHNIEFIYQPLWFWPSIVVALLGLIVVTILCLI